MHIVEFSSGTLRFLDALPRRHPAKGFLWIYLDRDELASSLALLQEAVQGAGGQQLLDLHVKDLANAAHPSRYGYTSLYDIVIFRRLAAAQEVDEELGALPAQEAARTNDALPSFQRIRTRPVGFVVVNRLLISVHPPGCFTARSFVAYYLEDAVQAEGLGGGSSSSSRNRLPAGPADLMLRMINVMVDSYLDLRKELSTEMDRWQQALLGADSAQAANWNALMAARAQMHLLQDLCEEQKDAMQEWLDTAREQPPADLTQAERDGLEVRAQDVIEHIDRVARQVERMEEGAETAVQIHFSAQSQRTNDIMRTLTVFTAIFLPLNLITGIFGMNFEFMPLLKRETGFWITAAAMVLLAVGLCAFFWRKRYLAQDK